MKKLWNLRIWFRNQRIKRKIIIIFIPLISIPLFVLAYVSNNIFTESVVKKTIVNVTDESRLIVTRIEESILNAENCANIITVSLNKIIPASQKLERDEFTEKKLVTQIVNQLGLDLLFFPDVEAVAFLDMDNQLSASNNLMENGLQTAFQSGIIQQINKTSGENIWFTMEARDFLTTVKDVPVKKPVSDIVNWKGQQFLISSMPFKKLNWKLVSQIPLSILTEDNRKITWFIVALGIFGIIYSLFGAEMLSRVIAKPLIRLTKTMLKVKEGDLKIYFSSNTSDEIGFLASGFNKMLEQIRELIDKVGTEQKQKRHYELALIQSQIKPHFLYNTLDIVYVLCSMNRVAEAKEATKALADFYRIALSGGREVITIGEELDNVNDYLAIQRIRYMDVFDFSINMDETILHDQILKLTIQPLVENAIYHGLKPKGMNGRLHIRGSCTDNDILITVSDNGVGIDTEKSKGLLNMQKSDNSNKSFGLLSVHERIKLYFGNEYGVYINSMPVEGTTIEVRLPKHLKGEEDNV